MQVVNFDRLWGADPRWYRLGDDVSLGRRGVSQAMVLYVLAGLASAWLGRVLPPVSWLAGGVSWWVWMPAIVGLAAAGAAVKPNGLRMHEFLPIVLEALAAPRHWLGWEPCGPLEGSWSPRPLPLLGDGSPGGEAIRYRGPGRLRIVGAVERTGEELVVRPAVGRVGSVEVGVGERLVVRVVRGGV
ncbi:hypothetical protein GKE82_24960 [Conexibacter sp. W3-3-2]|uniref:hypothetical protein n=1 Tax=Conexibacter sp. W3-3-2 TaxID=2675227 RepID=UPI0012B70937|nr:hypothetical protein [Conexibacter sp. W3-3-2]MTD47457.1 hypothetical protein [Conexibacter sp. W3-3-2]